MKPTAQSLILDLLSTLRGRAMPVRALLGVAELFDISANNIRVALARLCSRGVLERNERGCYRLAPGGGAVQEHVTSWRCLEDKLRPWRGAWVGAYTKSLPRVRGAAAARRRRALAFVGLAEWQPGLWIRADNLSGSVASVRERLFGLGLDREAPVFALCELDAECEQRARRLWDLEALSSAYAVMQRAIERSMAHLDSLSDEKAMKETFLVGGRVLHRLAFDPLLPEQIMPGRRRRELIAAMRSYDRAGRARWRRFLKAYGFSHLESAVEMRVLEEHVFADWAKVG